MKHFFSIYIPCLLLSLTLLSGCGRQSGTPAPDSGDAPEQKAVTKAEIIRGPLIFRILADRDSISFQDQLTITLEARAPEKFRFEFPPFGEDLQESFACRIHDTDTPLLDDSRVMLYRRSYILEPLQDGKQKIPAVKAIFTDQEAGGKEHILETDPFEIEITMPPREFWDKLDIDDKTGMPPATSLNPPRRNRLYPIAAAVILLAAAVLAVLVWYLRRRRRQTAPPPVPAHIIALAELRQLLEEDLVGRHLLKEFYGRISGILRKYIENRFQIRAPELTTEEFLSQLADAQTLLRQHQELLKKFLQFCDMVKFARHEPEEQDIQQTFDACKSFIAATQEAVES